MRTTPGPLHFFLHYLVVVPLHATLRAAHWAVAALDRAAKAAEYHRDRLAARSAGDDDRGHRRDDAQHEGGTPPGPPAGGR
jgi:hypothetical protein